MIGITTDLQPHANDWERQSQADSTNKIGAASSPGGSGALSHAARGPRVQPLLRDMTARDCSRDQSDCATATRVEFITRPRHEARRREQVG